MASGFPDEKERFRMSEGADSWGEWRRHVLIEMEDHSKSLKEMAVAQHAQKGEMTAAINALRLDMNQDMAKLQTIFNGEIAKLQTEIAMLKVKATFFGGMAAVLISIGVELIKGAVGK